MSRQKAATRVVAISLALLLACCWPCTGAALGATDDLSTKSEQELTRLKLVEEVEKLERENDEADGLSGFLVGIAPFVTALVAVGGLLATFWKQNSDQRGQRERDRREARAERGRRLEDRFAAILTELGAESPFTKAGAAASLVTYLQPRHRRFHHQVRLAVLTNLKLDHDEPIRKLLARVYATAVSSEEPLDMFELDLSRAKLKNADLSGLALREADLAFADLTDALLLGTDLYRARGVKVCLEGARLGARAGRPASLIEVRFRQARCQNAVFSEALLVNAHLEEADLRGASFVRARLQAAHLERALLEGAHFEQANLADTYFVDAELDYVALRSIRRAFNWRKAHFDPATRDAVELIEA